jgi:NadR type nicotinamide-nucleotide adenylyltransferase
MAAGAVIRHGLVLGKFLPPHAGHHELIDFAAARCERLTVAVLAAAHETIPVGLRRDWLRERHPGVRVVAGWDEERIDFADPHVHDLHIAVLRRLVPEPVDAVFTGEAYGDLLAERMGVRHVLRDRAARRPPISATAVRADPAAWWDALTPAVRAYLVRRVAVVGAESPGTTTLAAALAERLGTVWVPEVGRAVSEARERAGVFGRWSHADFAMIARRQLRDEDRAARVSGPVLVCDTNALATCVWQERYLGRSTAEVEALAASRSYALTVLTGDEIPFVQDGLRDGEHIRGWMTRRLRERLPAPWIEVRGSVEERVEAVIAAVRER